MGVFWEPSCTYGFGMDCYLNTSSSASLWGAWIGGGGVGHCGAIRSQLHQKGNEVAFQEKSSGFCDSWMARSGIREISELQVGHGYLSVSAQGLGWFACFVWFHSSSACELASMFLLEAFRLRHSS